MPEPTPVKARLQFGPESYRIKVGDGDNAEVSAEFDYGDPVEFVTEDGSRYLGFADVEGEGDPETFLEYWLYEAEPVESEPEDVEDFEGDGDEDEGEEEDEPEPILKGGDSGVGE